MAKNFFLGIVCLEHCDEEHDVRLASERIVLFSDMGRRKEVGVSMPNIYWPWVNKESGK